MKGLTSLERECYEGKVQRYRKMDYKPMMMMAAKRHTLENHILIGEYICKRASLDSTSQVNIMI